MSDLATLLAELDALTDWENRPRLNMRVTLEPMQDLMRRLGHPERAFHSVHVTGTKGKGSVSALIAAGLMHAGLSVGRYGSPHLEHISERIQLNDAPVSDDVLASALAQVLNAYKAARAARSEAADASWFDVLTAAAFVIFRQAGLAWAVVEVGLGGRLDSTNVVPSDIAVVTNVELEHVEVLGASRAAIAVEKGGILKPGTVLVTPLAPEDEAGRVLHDYAANRHARLLAVVFPVDASIETTNAAIAGRVLDALGETHPGLSAALLDAPTRAKARLPGRMERLTFEGVPVVLDGAHVPFNIAQVLKDLRQDPTLHGPCFAVVTLGADKDAHAFMAVLQGQVTHVLVTELAKKVRTRSAAELAKMAQELGLPHEATPNPHAALRRACALASAAKGWVLVTGSLYLVGVVRGKLAGSATPATS